MNEHKTKTLFDHLKSITAEQNPKYFDNLDESSIKTFSNYMIHRFLSMNPNWIDLISEIQPYTQTLRPREMYLVYIGLLPKGKYYLRYIKGKKEQKFESFLIELLVADYQCSKHQAIDYCEILYATKEGREHIKYVCEKYGTEKSQIRKLKLKLKK